MNIFLNIKIKTIKSAKMKANLSEDKLGIKFVINKKNGFLDSPLENNKTTTGKIIAIPKSSKKPPIIEATKRENISNLKPNANFFIRIRKYFKNIFSLANKSHPNYTLNYGQYVKQQK